MIFGNSAGTSTNSGGGIGNGGTLSVIESKIYDNTIGAGGGGGIASFGSGTVTVDRSTIFNNFASTGGGIRIQGGSLTINNSTIALNANGGGVFISSSGNSSINNSTISDNASALSANVPGGVYNIGVGSVTISNTILANNYGGSGIPDCYNIISLGSNIIGDTKNCGLVAASGDQFNINPQLGPFIESTGFYTLRSSSPALDSGNTLTCLGTDQRGQSRDGHCDIGAFELLPHGALASVWVVSGNDQHATPGQAYSLPLIVIALDADGNPMGAGLSVNFSAPISGASGAFTAPSSNSQSVLTDSSGIASSSIFTANTILGVFHVTATASTGAGATFELENIIWFVSPSGSNSNDCTTPTAPCADVAAVLEKPNFYSGDTVRVENGTYNVPGVNIIYVRKSASIIGGWNSDFTAISGISVFHDAIWMTGDVYPKVQLNLSYLLIEDTSTIGLNNIGQTLNIEHSTIRNNSAGVENWSGTTRIINSTIGINNSGNAIESRENGLPSNLVVVTNSTINGSVLNGDGAGEFRVENSIVAVCGGDFISNGYNVVGNAGDPNLFMCGGWLSSDFVGRAIPLDLSTIFNQTLTQDSASGQWYYPLVYHSVASENKTIDKIPVASGCPETDQLGIIRPEGAACDIGASEFVYPRAAAGIYDDKAVIWSYYGSWPTQKVTSAYGGSYRYATTAGASATAHFSGVQVKLYYTKNSSMGNLNIYIDDVLVTTLNQKSSTAKYKQIWLSPVYADGVHKITFARSSNKVNVDALEVIPAPDVIAPAIINTLTATSATGTSYGQVNLQWTSVGDDGNTGTAASYQIRYSISIIDTDAKWSTATAVTSGLPTPTSAGSPQTITVSGLAPSLTYYFSIRAVDDGGNLSPLSNSPFAVALAPVPVPPGTYENSEITTWIYNGTWTMTPITGASGGNVAACSIAGNSAALVFNGSGFTLRYYTKKGNGSMAVYVDGVLKTTLSQKSLSLATVWKTYVVSNLTPGTHVVQLVDSAGKVNFDNIIIAP
ncbi:MAG: hypothetical protein HFACDABA_00722 [Anaerolineales bacterium]|nr:hypothetical protein [Anaerolineales bacterium]